MRPQDTKRFVFGSPGGLTYLFGLPDVRDSEKPVVLLIHGMFSDVSYLLPWAEILGESFDVLLAPLPGHPGGAEFREPTVASIATALAEACAALAPGRRLYVVGDSIGGSIALAMGAFPGLSGVIAVESPLETGKLWSFWALLPRLRGRSAVPEAVIAGLMGTGPESGVSYRGLLDRLVAPAIVIVGDIPLQPPRTFDKTPSHLDQADHAAIGAAPLASLHVVSGGHLLMGERSDEVVRLVRAALDPG